MAPESFFRQGVLNSERFDRPKTVRSLKWQWLVELVKLCCEGESLEQIAVCPKDIILRWLAKLSHFARNLSAHLMVDPIKDAIFDHGRHEILNSPATCNANRTFGHEHRVGGSIRDVAKAAAGSPAECAACFVSQWSQIVERDRCITDAEDIGSPSTCRSPISGEANWMDATESEDQQAD